ncbi:MAG: HMG-box domain-containing protein [Candidatus Kapaibacteriota bacterium]
MLGGSGGSGCCNNGGAKKRVARKPAGKAVGKPKAKAKRGGNADPSTEPVEPVAEPAGESQGGGARKKKGSKVAAKRALSPYNKFVKKQFAILKKKFPDEKAPQIMQKVAIEWNKTKK